MSEKNISVTLEPLKENDREQFIKDNQYAFLYGATQEFGLRDDHFEEDGEIISRKTIEMSIDRENAETYRIMLGDKKVGGVVLFIDREKALGELDLLFVSPDVHSKGIGYSAWCEVEKMHPEIKVWETVTPYFEKRNIHFYVNRCGFHIVEFYNSHHIDPNMPVESDVHNSDDFDGMFRFRKEIEK
jgi:N-acetylglutamate synthase-like GNAT family acetyltransferase